MRIIIAIALLATTASAETIHNGRVYKTTADRIIEQQGLRCIYGRARIDPETGAIITPKVCVKATERNGQ